MKTDHTIETGDVVSYGGKLCIVESIHDRDFVSTDYPCNCMPIGHFTLIAKGLENLPKTIDDAIEIAEEVLNECCMDHGDNEQHVGAWRVSEALKRESTRKETA